MTENEARARLERFVAPQVEPVLSGDDINDLLAAARRPDRVGRVPSDEAWLPTWDLDAAASAGWELKAGRAAGDFNVVIDGHAFSRKQVHDQCLAMAKLYRRGSGSVTTRSMLPDTTRGLQP